MTPAVNQPRSLTAPDCFAVQALTSGNEFPHQMIGGVSRAVPGPGLPKRQCSPPPAGDMASGVAACAPAALEQFMADRPHARYSTAPASGSGTRQA
jgi:hypothetical protein